MFSADNTIVIHFKHDIIPCWQRLFKIFALHFIFYSLSMKCLYNWLTYRLIYFIFMCYLIFLLIDANIFILIRWNFSHLCHMYCFSCWSLTFLTFIFIFNDLKKKIRFSCSNSCFGFLHNKIKHERARD